MSLTRKTDEISNMLSKIKLDSGKRKELWDAIEGRIDSEQEVNQNPDESVVAKKRSHRFPLLGQLSAGLAAVVVIAGGMIYTLNQDSSGVNKAANNLLSPSSLHDAGDASSGNATKTSLTLPDGQTVTPTHSVQWKDLFVSLKVRTSAPVSDGLQVYNAIDGNQSTLVSHQTVSTSVGPATLVYALRPIAVTSQSSTNRYEYYAIVLGSQYTYVMHAVVTGNQHQAKGEVLQILKHWQIPASFQMKSTWSSSSLHSPYKQGITQTFTPYVPNDYEASILPRNGMADIISSAGAGEVQISKWWTKDTTFFSSPLHINGVNYSIPKTMQNTQLFILPIGHGIVWASSNQRNFSMSHPDVTGYTNVYFTPYHSSDASLLDGATVIAKVPHAWKGYDGPVIGSAWSGWLPSNRVVLPKIKNEVVRQLSFNADNSVKSDNVQTKPFKTNWKSLFMKNVPENPSGKADYSADVGKLIRTEGGFILQVGFTDITNTGRNSGMMGQGAYYYWSEQSKKWTPLTQLYMVQTITGDFSAGSGAVYWEETVPDDTSKQNGLDVAQMYYNPATNSMKSVWLGNWVYGGSFVDGKSWDTVLANNEKPTGTQPLWTIYTPSN